MSDDDKILSDVTTTRNGEPYREMVIEEDSGGITELGWRIDDKSATVLEACRAIVERCSAAQVQGVLVDLFSASAVVQVYDALSDANKKTLIERCDGDVAKLVTICFRVINRSSK